MKTYNIYYQEHDYFGEAYPELIQYVKTLHKDLTVLDLGCGQGRDSLAIGRLGFDVTGVDVCSVGIKQLNEIAKKENLHVKGLVGDLTTYKRIKEYDVVLMDSMFHFYKKDTEKETANLKNILNELKINGKLILCVQASKEKKDNKRNCA